MNKPKISLIAALGKKNRVIGSEGKIPWHISEDFKHFKKITLGHPAIMGRKTFESLDKALPGRTNIVVTSDQEFKADDAIVVRSIPEAIAKARKIENEEIFIIGG